MSIRSIQENDLSDSQIEDYQFVDEIDKDFIFEQVNPNYDCKIRYLKIKLQFDSFRFLVYRINLDVFNLLHYMTGIINNLEIPILKIKFCI